MGGQYRATVYPDGTADLHQIPCFAECKARSNGMHPPFDITRPWLEMAFRQHMQARQGQFIPPAHTKHHFAETPTGRAGFFAMTGVAPAIESGERKYAIYADILRIPAAVFAQIERGEWPYCSVEVGDWRRGIINSLALLDDEAPGHKFPLISVGQKQAAAAPAARFRSASVGRLVFRFAASYGANMDPNQMPPGMPGAAPAAPPAAPMAAPAAPPAAAPGAPAAPAAAPQQTVGSMTPEAFVALLVQGIKSAIGDDEQTSDPDNEPPSAEPEDLGGGADDAGGDDKEEKPADFAANGASSMSANIEGQFAQMRAKIATLEADKRKREAADRVAARFNAAISELAEFDIDAEMRQDIATFAAANDNGAGLKRYVAALKRVGIADPPESLQAAGFGAGRVDPPEVAAFAAHGPDALAKARAWHPAWRAAQNRGAKATFENFVAAQDEAGVSVQAADGRGSASNQRRGG